MNRKKIPERIKKKLRQQADNQCPICGENNEFTFEYHHIKPHSKGGEPEEENLILLCSNCHAKVHHGEISQTEILEVKESLRSSNHSSRASPIRSNVINFPGINRGQVANNIEKIEIKTQNKAVKLNPPPDAIAASLPHRNYVKYLIDRYHEFKKADVGQKNIYPIFYRSIKKEFGAKWDMVPLERFENLSAYIQARIDKTKLGRNRKSKGEKNYSIFEEYGEKYLRQR